MRRQFENELAERAAVVVRERVRRGSRCAQRVAIALVIGLVTVAARERDHALHDVAAECGRGRRAPAAVGRVVARLQREVRLLVVDREQIARVLGHEIDRAGETVAAVQRRGGAAQHFNTLIQIRIQIVAATRRTRAERIRLRQRHAVFEQQHLVAFEPANIDAFIARASRRPGDARRTIDRAAHFHARLVLERVLDVFRVVLVDVVAGDHRDGRRRAVRVRRAAARGRHGNGLERLFAARALRIHAFDGVRGPAGIRGRALLLGGLARLWIGGERMAGVHRTDLGDQCRQQAPHQALLQMHRSSP
ncbi:hypothetical protein PT2222_170105 [Paraburkholderia tropica]